MSRSEKCYHCGNPILTERVDYDEKSFCCSGCESVYKIFQGNNLEEFYELNAFPGIRPEDGKANKYLYLDEPTIAQRFILFDEGGKQTVKVFLPSIHCSSCIWILENLHKLNESVYNSEVNFVSKKALITFNSESLKLSELALLLDRIGYKPIFDTQEEKKKDYSLLIKLAVAGFCFGNVMLLSFPEYLNLDDSFINEFRDFFAYLIFVFSLPVILYSARDYLDSAFKAIRSKQVNIDVPISLGILALYGKSSFDIFSGLGPGYMDSFTGFIFFLLIGKWFQSQTYKALSFERNYKSYFPLTVSVLKDEEEVLTPLEDLKIGDLFSLRNEEIIPADSIMMSDNSSIDYSFVTGESDLMHKQQGDKIYAGGKHFGETIKLQTIKEVNQSYLTSLWNKEVFSEEYQDTFTNKTNRISKYFIWIVLILSAVTALVWSFIDVSQIINIVVSVLIVACPCALALSVPFTYGNTMQKFGRNNLYLKNTDVVEKMSSITDIIFDKTGTITQTDFVVKSFDSKMVTEEDLLAIMSLSYQSSHPLSKAVYSFLANSNRRRTEIKGFTSEVGKGILGVVEGDTYKLGSANFIGIDKGLNLNETEVYVSKNQQNLGLFRFESSYRKGLVEVIEQLKKSNYSLHILSGDNDSEKEYLSQLIGTAQNIHFNQKPIDKLNYVANLQKEGRKVMMLGDGLNDSGALKQSNVGMVISEDVYNFSPASDAILSSKEFDLIPDFMKFSTHALLVLKLSLIFSLLYNIIGFAFAASGLLTPLIAAILMPLSSISVVILTTILIRVKNLS